MPHPKESAPAPEAGLPKLTDDDLFTVWDEHYENVLSYNRPSLDRGFMRAVIAADRAAIALDRSQREASEVTDPDYEPIATRGTTAIVDAWNAIPDAVRLSPALCKLFEAVKTCRDVDTPPAPGRAAGVGAVPDKHVRALNAALTYRNYDPEAIDEQDAWAELIEAISALNTPPASPSLADMVPKAEGEAVKSAGERLDYPNYLRRDEWEAGVERKHREDIATWREALEKWQGYWRVVNDRLNEVQRLLTPEQRASLVPWARPIDDPFPLHPETTHLVAAFGEALRNKLARAEAKYGFTDGWARPDWMDECRDKLVEHLAKGDPLDVAAYCAFLWHHGASTAPSKPSMRTIADLAGVFDEGVRQGASLAAHTGPAASLVSEDTKRLDACERFDAWWYGHDGVRQRQVAYLGWPCTKELAATIYLAGLEAGGRLEGAK